MKLVKYAEGAEYDAKGHTRCFSVNKLMGGKDTKRLTMALSHFLPGGGCEMSSAPAERVYIVLNGCLKVTGKGQEYLVGPNDLIYIPAGEDRAFTVQGIEPATIMVAVVNLD